MHSDRFSRLRAHQSQPHQVDRPSSNRAKLVALCDTNQDRLDSTQQLVTETAEENTNTENRPEQFIGYDNLLAAMIQRLLKLT